KRVFDFNQALMDFGALVCAARNPKCGECPMAGFCEAFRLGARGSGLGARPAAPKPTVRPSGEGGRSGKAAGVTRR
ncbi:MAG TPA: hypothetical protein PKZ08_11955, partial [Vicinamibacterales bacterium]|nr:hypothetical protein [Vicinamibacterales bacterium]